MTTQQIEERTNTFDLPLTRPLTRRQREIIDFVGASIDANGFAPSLAEIGERFHLSSLATVHKHLVNLETKGYIRRRWNCARSIELTFQSGVCPTCRRPMDAPVEATV